MATVKETKEKIREERAKQHTSKTRMQKLKEQLKRLVAKRHIRPNFNGHPSNVNDRVKKLIVKANRYGLYVTSTTDGSSHTSTSYHYTCNNSDGLGGAVDLGGSWENMIRFQRYLHDPKRIGKTKESFGPDNDLGIKYGNDLNLVEGSGLEKAHDNHVHCAPY